MSVYAYATKERAMAMVETRYEHIVLDALQSPLIAGTTMKVVELALEHLAYGWSAAELHFQHPYLSLGQIYSALAYYWDHQLQFDQEIAHRRATVAHIRQQTPRAPFIQRINHGQ
jgi:uncharacterized protein (DUF433 family)